MVKKSEGKAEWAKMKPEEVEKIVVDLAKKGIPSEKIGLILRDEHGVPKARLFGKKIKQILKENNLYTNSELNNLKEKVERIKKHTQKHKHDFHSKKYIGSYIAKIHKLEAKAP